MKRVACQGLPYEQTHISLMEQQSGDAFADLIQLGKEVPDLLNIAVK